MSKEDLTFKKSCCNMHDLLNQNIQFYSESVQESLFALNAVLAEEVSVLQLPMWLVCKKYLK